MRSNDDDHDNDNNNNNMTEVVLSRIAAMRRQEETIYNAPVVAVAAAKVSSSSSASTRGLSSQQRQAQHNDDDHHHQQHDQHQQSCDTAPTSKTSSPETDHRHHHHHHHHHVDCIRRSKVAAWLYRVADYCHFRRETVNIAITNLDRYMETPAATTARSDRAVYTLAAMTALYTAIKVHDSTVETADLSKRIISLYATNATDSNSSSNNLLAAECKCNFTTKQVECMELEMLMALEWRINPPTALAFCREFLRLVPNQVLSGARRERVVHLVAYQTQLAFVDGGAGNLLSAVKASTIAFCAFMNALEMIRVPEKILGFVAYLLAEAVGVNCNDRTVVRIQNKLYQRTTTTTSSLASAASPAVPTTLTPPPLPQRRRHRQERMTTTASASLSLSVVGTAVTSHHHNHHDTRSRIRRTARIKQFAASPQSTAVTIPAWY